MSCNSYIKLELWAYKNDGIDSTMTMKMTSNHCTQSGKYIIQEEIWKQLQSVLGVTVDWRWITSEQGFRVCWDRKERERNPVEEIL